MTPPISSGYGAPYVSGLLLTSVASPYAAQDRCHTNFLGAIVLVVHLAGLALHARPDLSSNADAVANLDRCHLVADLDGFANDFVSHTERHRGTSPASTDSVDI